MQNVLIYPYDEEFSPILSYKELMSQYQITKVVSLRGWGLCGKEAGAIGKRNSLGFIVTDEFENNLDECDAVLFCETKNAIDFEKLIMPKIDMAIKFGKDIIVAFHMNQSEIDLIWKKCMDGKVGFKNYYRNTTLQSNLHMAEGSLGNLEINTPVIFVFGMSQKTNKFDIQLSLRKNFLERGYQVSQIGSRNYCELMGFHSFPCFMNAKLQESVKIRLFNRYIKEIENTEAPDVIIIGIPGGIFPINKKFTNYYGIYAYEISQAVMPDAAVFSCLYDEFTQDYFQLISTSIKNRFGFEVDCFNISNHFFDWNKSESQSKEIYVTVQSDAVDERIGETKAQGIVIGNSLNKESAKEMADCLLDKLIGYAEAECM